MKLRTRFVFLLCLITALFCLQSVSAENSLIADTGFRVGKDGFGFENYGAQGEREPNERVLSIVVIL